MQIENDFELSLSPDDAYALLLDLERVVPCMPGAELGEAREDGSREVKVSVRLGPIKMSYKGTAEIADRDDGARRAVLRGDARETAGQGSAKADISMTVTPNGDGSNVATVADVQLTGRAAQAGRGIVQDVARRMVADMAKCLDERYSRPAAPAAADAPAAGGAGPAPAADSAAAADSAPAAAAPASSPTPAKPASPPAPAKPIKGGRLMLSILWDRLRRLFRRR